MTPNPELMVIVNRYANDDLFSWQPLHIGVTGPQAYHLVRTLPPDAEVGDLIAYIPMEYASDIIRGLITVLMVNEELKLSPLPENQLRSYGNNYLQVFLSDMLQPADMWEQYAHFDTLETVEIMIALMGDIEEFFDNESLSRVLRECRLWAGNPRHTTDIRKAREACDLSSIKTKQFPLHLTAAKNSALRSLDCIYDLMLKTGASLNIVRIFIQSLTNARYNIHLLRTGQVVSTFHTGIEITNKMRPYFDFRKSVFLRTRK